MSWVKLSRQMLDAPFAKKPEMTHLYMYLLLLANYKEEDGLKAGQVCTSLRELSKQSGLTFQTLRTCVRKLERYGYITQQLTQKVTQGLTQRATLITICNYEGYEGKIVGTNTTTNTRCNTETNTTSKEEMVSPNNINNNPSKEENIKEEIKEKISPNGDSQKRILGSETERVKDLWNEICGDAFQKVIKMSPSRVAKVKLRIHDLGDDYMEKFKEIFTRLRNAPFCIKGSKSWCNFDWIITNDNNYIKVLEGKYDQDVEPNRPMTQYERNKLSQEQFHADVADSIQRDWEREQLEREQGDEDISRYKFILGCE